MLKLAGVAVNVIVLPYTTEVAGEATTDTAGAAATFTEVEQVTWPPALSFTVVEAVRNPADVYFAVALAVVADVGAKPETNVWLEPATKLEKV